MKCLLIVVLVIFSIAAIGNKPVATDVTDSCVLIFNDYGHGSGAIIEPNCVLTARHVAQSPDLRIRTNDGDEHVVVRTWLDPDSDLAKLYIDGRFTPPPLTLDRTPLRVGNKVAVIGTPHAEELLNCVLWGQVVKVDYKVQVEGIEHTNLDVYDCHTAMGCSGGPVVDRWGRIRGVFNIGWPPLGAGVPVGELDR